MGQDVQLAVSQWRDTATRKRADRETQLVKYGTWRIGKDPPEGTIDVSHIPLTKLTDAERTIVKSDATDILILIQKRKYTAVDVLTAFAKVAVATQDLTNCLSEVFLEDAFVRARELDKYLEDTGNVVGQLHGLPVSIKDHIKIQGIDTSTGYVAWAYNSIADRDALAVDILRKAGAVLFVKTQNPQTLLSLETNNNIFGRALNPFNRNLTPGGSSGGESALIACHGSPMGVGTDIGGSIRVPAAHCGLYGIKVSVARLPHGGLMGSHDGLDAIIGCLGPLATSARDLELFCRVMLENRPWLDEPPLLEMPWKSDVARGEDLPEKLTIAILFDDGVVTPHPPITDALKRSKDALIAAGHDVIDWRPVEHKEAWELIVKLYLLDAGAEYYDTLEASGEPAVKQTKWILDHAKGRQPFTTSEIFKLNSEREALRARALAHWNATQARTASGRPVDAILCPVAATLAPPHDSTCWWGYSSHWNLLDLPGVVFPVGRFSAGDELPSQSERIPRNDIEEFIQNQWHPATYENAPISLQLVGRRHNEERLLAMLNIVENVLRCDSNEAARKMNGVVSVNGSMR
jgi:amidase